MYIVRALLLLMALAMGSAVIFEDCGSAYELRAVNIEGCDVRLPCYITIGEDVPVNLEFYAGFVSRNLDQNVVININYLNLKTPVTPAAKDFQTVFESGVRVPFYDRVLIIKLNEPLLIIVLLFATHIDVLERCEVNDCPVQTGTVTSYTSIMSVPDRIALNQRGYLRWRVENEVGKQVLCYSVLVQTQSPLQKILRKYLGTIPDIDNDSDLLTPVI